MKHDDDYLAVALLVLSSAVLGGMLFGSWEAVLYPALLLIGVTLAMGLATQMPAFKVSLPLGVTAVLVALFATLHVMGLASPSGEGSFLGFDPLTAFYLLVLGPAYVSIGLVYALADRKEVR